MHKFSRLKLMILLIAASLCGCAIPELHNRNWAAPETGNLEGMIDAYIDPDNATCKEDQCTFQLHYFIGGDSFSKNRKTILFIPGGPGYVVKPEHRDLESFETFYNVVYFDIRGSGRSQIPTSNKYDKYLRAKYVVEDIENLRKHLGINAWDAIYAHSFGTVVAQRYANKYGQKTDSNPTPRVTKLIFSAPPARYQELENQRREQRMRNLEAAFQHYSKNCTCAENQARSSSGQKVGDAAIAASVKAALLAEATNLTRVNVDVNSGVASLSGVIESSLDQKSRVEHVVRLVDGVKKVINNLQLANTENAKDVNDFCFLSSRPGQIEIIKERLTDIMERLENEYGSLAMVSEHYKELIDTNFATSYPFPKGFFSALQVLESYGAKEYNDENLGRSASDDVKKNIKAFNLKRFNAAFVLGYYAASNYLKIQQLRESCSFQPDERVCMAETQEAFSKLRSGKPFLNKGFFDPESPECMGYGESEINDRLPRALESLETSDSGVSLRAYYVFGLYDGISSWLARENGKTVTEGEITPCVSAEAIGRTAESSSSSVVQKHLKRIGVANESICPWRPADYKHHVSTLILRGGADPATAGGQAEDVFRNGLEGDRILIELEEVGHGMIMLLPEEKAHLVLLVMAFVDNESFDRVVDGKFCDNAEYFEAKVKVFHANSNELEVCRALAQDN
jgi:pimeloyl-ACP methyl ester carboxylesterase